MLIVGKIIVEKAFKIKLIGNILPLKYRTITLLKKFPNFPRNIKIWFRKFKYLFSDILTANSVLMKNSWLYLHYTYKCFLLSEASKCLPAANYSSHEMKVIRNLFRTNLVMRDHINHPPGEYLLEVFGGGGSRTPGGRGIILIFFFFFFLVLLSRLFHSFDLLFFYISCLTFY